MVMEVMEGMEQMVLVVVLLQVELVVQEELV